MIQCPICSKPVKESNINNHLDNNCATFVETENGDSSSSSSASGKPEESAFTSLLRGSTQRGVSKASATALDKYADRNGSRAIEHSGESGLNGDTLEQHASAHSTNEERPAKRIKTSSSGTTATNAHLANAAPLADRMRPRTLDQVRGQALVSPDGVLRGLIETNRVPSMILWGGAGTGKTTIARLIAHAVKARFVEINSTWSGVGECKKIFTEARSELGVTGRKTVLFCDEIHRFSKSQQDVFLGPVESGQITLIGATTENPSFKVQNALLSRCRTFTLQKLSEADISAILKHALATEGPNYKPNLELVDDELIAYLAAFADGDARTALNLLELAMQTSQRAGMTSTTLKSALTQTLVYDRAGDQHYDSISALHKSIRGSDPDAAIYYLARMIASGEDARFIARRLVVAASEDIGLADNSLLPLATAAYDAAERIGWPEARIPLAHVTVALALAPKSTRAYRALASAEKLLAQPGIAGLPIPLHLRNAPTRLLRDLGYGAAYKYNPDYRDGRVRQDYLPEKLKGVRFLEDCDLGHLEDEDARTAADAEQHQEGSGREQSGGNGAATVE